MARAAPLAVALTIVALVAASATFAANQMAKTHSKAHARDTLSLTARQQTTIWNDVSRHAADQRAPSGFDAAAGTAVPSAINTYPLPRRAARDVPKAKPYRYAMAADKVLLVNPSDDEIADVVTKQ